MIPKMIPNPAWSPSSDEKLQKQLTINDMIHRGECPEDAFPEEYSKDIPDAGSWIMLLVTINVGKMLDDGQSVKCISVPRFSLWYAMPHISNMRIPLHDLNFKKGSKREFVHLRQSVITTLDGAIHIWPHEYKKVDINKFLEFCEEDGFSIHYLSEEAQVNKDALFYLRSRGISKADAQRMLLGTLTNPNYCYFTFAPEVVECFGEGAGTPYLYPINHQRRSAAKARTNLL